VGADEDLAAMTEPKYEGYSLKQIMLEGLSDAVKAHMLKLWSVATTVDNAHRESGVQAVREGLQKARRMYEGGVRLIEEEIPDDPVERRAGEQHPPHG
jgi:hypothetical protein